jgi:catechol-2,3-dioxygenase
MHLQDLQVYTPQLQTQRKFYSEFLGLNIVNETQNSVSFEIGESVLIFEHLDNITPYHFAINIPSFQEKEALSWLKSKNVDILKNESKEIQDFDDWNAKAIYFYDADKNIVELIARKNLNIISNMIFDQSAFIRISEIGLVTVDIETQFKVLSSMGLEIYDGDFDRFCAIGDENGLFICVNPKLKDSWFPTHDKPYASDFSVNIVDKLGRELQLVYSKGVLLIEK